MSSTIISLFDKINCFEYYEEYCNTFFFYSKSHNVWFIANRLFIKNYDPSKSFKDTVIEKNIIDEDIPVAGLYGIYNRDEKSAYILLYRRRAHREILLEIDPSLYEKYHCFYKIPNIEMTSTDFLQGIFDTSQQDCDMNYILDYSDFMNSISHTSYEKKPHYKIDGIQKGPNQTIPKPGNEFIDLMVRTGETYNDEPIFELTVPYPEVNKTFMKHIYEKYLQMNRFTKYQLQTIRYEKLFHERVIQKYNINHMIDEMTESLINYITNECYKFTRQKMKKNSCMWKVIDDRNMGEIYDTRTVIKSLLKELFCNIRHDITGLFNIESIVLEVYNYITSKEGIIISPIDKIWKTSEVLQQFYDDSAEKIEKYSQFKLEVHYHSWLLVKKINTKFKETLTKEMIEIAIIQPFNKRFPRLVKSSSASSGGGGGGGGGGDGSLFATE